MLRFFFSGQGRISRRNYWLYWVLPSSAVLFGLDFLLDQPLPADFLAWMNPFDLVVSIIAQIAHIAISARRFHDLGMSGWWALWVLIIFYVGVLLLAIGAAASFTDRLSLPYSIEGSWFILLGLLVMLGSGLWFFIKTGVSPGQPGPNRYGPDPLDPRPDEPNIPASNGGPN